MYVCMYVCEIGSVALQLVKYKALLNLFSTFFADVTNFVNFFFSYFRDFIYLSCWPAFSITKLVAKIMKTPNH